VKLLREQFASEQLPELSALAKRLKFVDESGAHLGLTRLFGRAARGERVHEGTPGPEGEHYTLVAALGWQGVEASWLLSGAMDTLAFEAYVQQVLAPSLRKGDLVVLDNLSAHKGELVRTLIAQRGACLVFLPPYSPDFNPIELCWSKIKTALRAAKARTLDVLLAALAEAFSSVSLSDIQAWFAHCGYAVS
jgi:transposase